MARVRETILLGFAFLLAGCGEPSPDPDGEVSVTQSGEEKKETLSFTTNVLKWETASEEQLFGFELMRAETEEGPFVRLNDRPLPAGGTTDEPRRYRFDDERAVPGKTYYYFIQSLSFSNVRKPFSPVFPFQTPAKP